MVLHTIIGEYDILEAQNKFSDRRIQAVNGGMVEYTVTPEGKEISRLISTDPAMYLNKDFQPFTKLL